jgi:hypothetical protein
MRRPGKAASPPPPKPVVQELGPDQLRDALKYGLLASAAYSDEEDKVQRLAWHETNMTQ